MPIYNKAERLSSSIESVLAQTFTDFELIMINDGSTDGSHDIAVEYKRKDPRIIYFKQRNQGTSITRNNAINLARGEYIAFLDADDIVHPEFLSKMVWKSGGENVCYCGHYSVTEKGRRKARLNFAEGDLLSKFLRDTCNPHLNSWLIKKSFLDDYGIRFSPGVSWGEDLIFFSKVLVNETNVIAYKDYLTEYHIGIGQSGSLDENSMDKIKKDIEWMGTVKQYVGSRVKDPKRRDEAIAAIDSYRIAGAIMSHLDRNSNLIEKEDLRNLIGDYGQFIRIFNFSNGVRSIKFMLVYLKLRVQLLF